MILTSEQEKLLDEPIATFGFNCRTLNYLEGIGITTLEDLLNHTPEQLKKIPNFGNKTLEDVYKVLAAYGFHRTNKKVKKCE